MSLTDDPSSKVVVDARLAQMGAFLFLGTSIVSVLLLLAQRFFPTLSAVHGANGMLIGAGFLAAWVLLWKGTTEREVGLLAVLAGGVDLVMDVAWFLLAQFSSRQFLPALSFLSAIVGLAVHAITLLFLWKLLGARRPWVLFLLIGVAAVVLFRLLFGWVVVPFVLKDSAGGPDLMLVAYSAFALVTAALHIALGVLLLKAVNEREAVTEFGASAD